MKIKISQIIPDLNQPRKTFKEETLQELKDSYGNLGLIQPITVRPIDDKYMIVIGERRYRASLLNGQKEIECIVRDDIDDKKVREMQFAENSQQEQVPPVELGESFYNHRQKYHLSQYELGKLIGLSDTQIGHYETLHKMPTELVSYVNNGQLDARTAYEISRLPNADIQIKMAKAVVSKDLGRDITTKIVQLVKSNPTRPIESAISQVQYNMETEKTNHRDLLNEYKRQHLEPQPTPQGKYKTIIIDPPWPIEKILRDVRPNQFDIEYPTMTIEEIIELPIADLADENGCHIYLWTTHKFLPTSFEILDTWGAKYQCLLTWVKNVGMTPFSWMYSTEHCLFARIGNLDLLKMGKRLDFNAKVREHSRKPDEFYELVKEVSPEPRIDYFAREQHNGFAVWGNETSKFKDTVKV